MTNNNASNEEVKSVFDPPLSPTISREEYQDLLDAEKNGWIDRSRKALAAGATAFAGALGIGIPTVFADGVVTLEEIIPLTVASIGIGLAAGCATWATPNAELYK
jgi:hypothetical protein